MAKILVIDDEESTRKGLETFLTANGHEVETANGGETGLEKVKAFRPHIVLLDIRMPGMSGLEVLPLLKGADPTVRIIMLTAIHQEEIARMAVEHGAIDYITKPVDLDHLKTVIMVAGIEATG